MISGIHQVAVEAAGARNLSIQERANADTLETPD
jgi:hypothetical protein